MKIKASSGSRILFEGEDMFLTEYCDDSNMWFWKIIGEKFFKIEKGFKEQGSITPWFNQPGQGSQIMFSEDIEELIKEGKIEIRNLKEIK